mmetsp:Transcript_4124/g.9340  ORF Transcript_4124/g.9340 Transcript_4124/m.9340 type:complete len:91 (-) Transcript_4124:255-527(-)
MGLLGVFHLSAPAQWPEYAARLQVELLEDADGAAFVRFSLNEEVLRCGFVTPDSPVELVELGALLAEAHRRQRRLRRGGKTRGLEPEPSD